MTFTLPIVGNSSGTWGTTLNATLTDMEGRINTNTGATGTNGTNIAAINSQITTINNQITTINGKITALESKPPGGIIVGTTATLPAVTVGQVTLATDTGYLSYGANISGTPTRVPWPGSWVGTFTQTVVQTMPNNTNSKMLFDTVNNDRLGGWTSATKSRYTCKLAGTYEFNGGASFDANKVGWRKTSIMLGGVEVPGNNTVTLPDNPPAGGAATTVCSISFRPTILKLAVGQYVEVVGIHTATVPLDTFIVPSYQPNLRVKYLGYDA